MKGEFYKMDFRAWNGGTQMLTLEQEAAYLRLCHAMYDARGPIPNSIHMLMGMFRCGNVKASALMRQLKAAGKIQELPDGRLVNDRVLEELAERDKVSNARKTAGQKGGSATRVPADRRAGGSPSGARSDTPSDPQGGDRVVTRVTPLVTPEWQPSGDRVDPANPLKNKGSGQPIAPRSGSREEERREERRQEEEEEQAASLPPAPWEPGGDAPTPSPTGPELDRRGQAYAFADGVIKLNQRDFDAWVRAFPHITVEAELIGLSGWATRLKGEGKDWFDAIKAGLSKKNREAGERKLRIKAEADAAAKRASAGPRPGQMAI